MIKRKGESKTINLKNGIKVKTKEKKGKKGKKRRGTGKY